MNKVYLVRHGENLANITKEFSYKLVDYDLTEKGRVQAQQTADYLASQNIDEIFSSPLKRATQTAEYIAKKLNKQYEIIEQFREVNVGKLEKKAPDKNSWDIYFNVTNDWYAGKKETKFPDGEDYFTLYNRFIKGLETITSEKDKKNIVVVGHGGIFTACLLELCSIKDKKEFVSQKNSNCSITEIIIEKGLYKNVQLLYWADSKHLSGEAAILVNGLPER